MKKQRERKNKIDLEKEEKKERKNRGKENYIY